MQLLYHAAVLWESSGNDYPPLPHEIIYRDLLWDEQVAMMREGMRYKVKKKNGEIE